MLCYSILWGVSPHCGVCPHIVGTLLECPHNKINEINEKHRPQILYPSPDSLSYYHYLFIYFFFPISNSPSLNLIKYIPDVRLLGVYLNLWGVSPHCGVCPHIVGTLLLELGTLLECPHILNLITFFTYRFITFYYKKNVLYGAYIFFFPKLNIFLNIFSLLPLHSVLL